VPSKREPSEYTTALESSREAISLLCSSAAFPLSDLDRWNVMPAGSTSHLPFTVSTIEAGLIQSFNVLSSLTREFGYLLWLLSCSSQHAPPNSSSDIPSAI